MKDKPNKFLVINAENRVVWQIARAIVSLFGIAEDEIFIKIPKDKDHVDWQVEVSRVTGTDDAWTPINRRYMDCDYKDWTKGAIWIFLQNWIIPQEVKHFNIKIFKKDNTVLLYLEYDSRYTSIWEEITMVWWIFDVRWRQILPWNDYLNSTIEVYTLDWILIFKVEEKIYKVSKNSEWKWLSGKEFDKISRLILQNNTKKLKHLWTIHEWLFW